MATGAEPRSNAHEATRVLEVLNACQRSLSAGAPVAVGAPEAAEAL